MVNTSPEWRLFWTFTPSLPIHKSRDYVWNGTPSRERPCQILADVIAPLPAQPNQPRREDNEYKRNGTAVVLLAYDLDSGQRYVQVRQRRTKQDYAEFMYHLQLHHYPNAQQIHVLQDNLNTHQPGSFYERFDALIAHQLSNQFVWHYTPKHGSWLNMAEIEFAALSKQCLDRRIGDLARLEKEVLAWVEERNRQALKIKRSAVAVAV